MGLEALLTPFLGPVAPFIGPIMSGIGSMQSRKQKTGTDLGRLRKDAIKHGFNPLTVLQATGGAGFSYAQKLPVFSILGDTITGIQDNIQNAELFGMQKAEHEAGLSLTQAQTGMVNAQTKQLNTPTAGGLPASRYPLAAKYADKPWNDIPYIKVRNANGTSFDVNAVIAERLGIVAGQVWMAEDNEALLGEIAGELYGAGALINDLGRSVNGQNPVFRKLDFSNTPITSEVIEDVPMTITPDYFPRSFF